MIRIVIGKSSVIVGAVKQIRVGRSTIFVVPAGWLIVSTCIGSRTLGRGRTTDAICVSIPQLQRQCHFKAAISSGAKPMMA
jgi:hypothetical protein